MPGTNLVKTLTTTYAKLLGELEFADRTVMDTGDGLAAFDEAVYQAGLRKKDINEKLAAIETVVWMFDPDWDPSAIRPNLPRQRHLKPGMISRATYAILRDAEIAMTTREIARVVASRLGYEKPDERDFPEGFDPMSDGGMGFTLIRSLTDSLGSSFKIDSGAVGSTFRLTIDAH